MISFLSPAKFGSWLLSITLLLNFTACTEMQMRTSASKGWWRGDGVEGKPKIVINLSKQQVNYFKGGRLVGVSVISSGREGHHTITGSYHIVEKDMDHRSSLYGAFCDANRRIVVPDVDASHDHAPAGTHFIGASMPYFMRITGGYGMHEGYLPGYPASHGCIRLPGDMARTFFYETPVGTPVEIIGDASLAVYQPAVVPPPVAVSTPPPPAPVAIAPPPPPHVVSHPAPPKKTESGRPPPRHPRPAVAKAAPPKIAPTTDPTGAWLRIGRVTDHAEPVPLPFGTTIYLQR